ncbi:MAG TPA: hypothetical protein VHB25_17970 [Gemmatimonadaceae bacterium]|nr:hypothetical protein [Gemmatimonadaceae bacterium]
MADERPDLDEVAARLRQIQAAKRNRIRWKISRHTAEMAIDAIEPRAPHRRSAKARRRKRNKRLL